MYINKDMDYLDYLQGRKIIIFGAGKAGVKGIDRIRRSIVNADVIAVCDNDMNKVGTDILNVKVISFDELKDINNGECMIVICSGYEREIKQQLLDNGIYNFISFSQIDFGGGEEYYDEAYFKWQKSMGIFGGKIKSNIFKPYIKDNMTVVEFGSGGGFLLDNITAMEKVGIEINDSARKSAEEIGIKSVKNISDINDEYADIIISTSVLEHVENPLGVLRELRAKLKKNGKIVFHVPNESCDIEYTRSDVNNHLYTWNCMTIGNLFKAAGYFVYSVEKVQEVWPKNFYDIEKEISPEFFESICLLGGKAFNENRCIIVAYK